MVMVQLGRPVKRRPATNACGWVVARRAGAPVGGFLSRQIIVQFSFIVGGILRRVLVGWHQKLPLGGSDAGMISLISLAVRFAVLISVRLGRTASLITIITGGGGNFKGGIWIGRGRIKVENNFKGGVGKAAQTGTLAQAIGR